MHKSPALSRAFADTLFLCFLLFLLMLMFIYVYVYVASFILQFRGCIESFR